MTIPFLRSFCALSYMKGMVIKLMTIIALDDEELLLWRLEQELKKVFPNANILSFDRIADCIDCLERTVSAGGSVEYAFLDIQLSDGTGLEMAKRLRESFPTIRIIFCTAYSEYSMDAFRLYANGYLLKPVKAAQIRELLSTTEPMSEAHAPRVSIQTFGNFDVFIDGKLVLFTKSKAKELLAYLVDRKGASVSSAEIGAVLWEDDTDAETMKDRVQHVKKDLRDILSRYKVEDILISGWNSIALDRTKVSCDYYGFLQGEEKALQSYLGEYMTNYSWAEETAGALIRKKNKEP